MFPIDKNQIGILAQNYFEFDKPVPFKNFSISPAKVKDYYDFYYGVECLTLEKNKDINGIRLSHLGYLFHKFQTEPEKHYDIKLSYIVKICLGIEDGTFKAIFDLNGQPCIAVGNHAITKEDFDDIRKIICYQNMPHFDDSYIDPELEQDIKDRDAILNKNQETPSLEKQTCCIIASGCKYDFETIQEMTLRKLSLMLQTMDGKMHYQIYKHLETSGEVTFKGGVNHWIYEKKKNKFDDMILADNLTQKLDPYSKK